ncbi:MAG TPA: DNA repair protein RadA [Candidatus Dormibacteraeota bacterium]|nr:DNA repair protein RadA [Candidatus Dormibacteraeota bacterium]
MPRAQSRYVCQACGEAFLRWEGQCRSCGSWNSLVETVVREPSRSVRGGSSAPAGAPPTALAAIGAEAAHRYVIGIGELDRVLGGGIVPGSVVLVGGEPGIGKSTLLLQAAAGLASAGGVVLYVSGEESAPQVRLRAARLGLIDGRAGEGIRVVAETDVGRIAEHVRALRPALVIVDSIQTVRVDELDGPAGSVGQVREAAQRLQELAKGEGIPVLLVGHVTKDGSLAGPKTLEHLVDVVLALEGERYAGLRLLRAAKNRFGSTDEVGVFEMVELGLREVADPARAFVVEHPEPAAGSAVGVSLEGTRCLLVEVQALVAPASGYGPPRRTPNGLDPSRLAVVIAVLGRRAGLALGTQDVYASLAGGLALDDPALDLPLALALASSLRDRPLVPGTVAVGEVGLLGELRGVPGLERRVREAARLGFSRAVVASAASLPERGLGLEVLRAATLRDALAAALAPAGATRRHGVDIEREGGARDDRLGRATDAPGTIVVERETR